MGRFELDIDYLNLGEGIRVGEVSTDESFSSLYEAICEEAVRPGRDAARALLETPINTKGLVIHTEKEIEGENENGRDEDGRDETRGND